MLTSIITDPYVFSTGPLGLTACAPFVDIVDGEVKKFYGSICMDQFMSSGTRSFINKFYGSNFEGQLIDYLVYQDETEYLEGNYEESKLFTALQDLVFNNKANKRKYTLHNITREDRKIDEINEQIKAQRNSSNVDRIALLPDNRIEMGTINTTDKETGEITEFFFINDEIRFPLTPVQEYDFSVDRSKLEYQEKSFKIIFVLPKSIIQEKVDTIFWNLANFIQISIIIPFTVTTLIMMLFGGYFLNKIAQGVTSPIVELQEKIGDIIRFRNEEK